MTRCPVWGWSRVWRTQKLGKEQQYFFESLSFPGRSSQVCSFPSSACTMAALVSDTSRVRRSFFLQVGLLVFVFKTKRTFSRSFRQTSLRSLWPKYHHMLIPKPVTDKTRGIIWKGLDQLNFIPPGQRWSQPSLRHKAGLYLNKIRAGWQSRKERNGY